MELTELSVMPKPVQRTIPIVIGGLTTRVAQRAARLGDGFFPLGARSEDLAAIVGLVSDEEQSVGQGARSVEITLGAPKSIEEQQ